MIFSKSFGYAVRGVLYIALLQQERRYVQAEEISKELAVPRHFMGKILKRLVKEKVLVSVKGPAGGFALGAQTMKMPLLQLTEIMDGLETFKTCALRLKECNPANPCPMHGQVEVVKTKWHKLLSDTKIEDLLGEDKASFVKSISTAAKTSAVKSF